MNTQALRKFAAVLSVAWFGTGVAVVSAAPAAPRQGAGEAVPAIRGSDNVQDKIGHEALQLLIFIHRANLPAGGAAQGAQR